jgi:serine/threonine protein kinase
MILSCARVLSVGEEVGRGSFAYVCKAVVSIGGAERDDVVVKVSRLPSSLSIMWESHVLLHVRHYSPPHVQLLAPLWTGRADLGARGVALASVLPLARGGDAIRWVGAQPRPLPAASAAAVFRDLAHTLHAFHSNGVAHMDICMENLLFIDGDRCCIADAGLAINLVPRHDFWKCMRAECSIAALFEYKKWEAYCIITSSHDNDMINEAIATKIRQMDHMPFAKGVREELQRIVDSPPESRRHEAWTHMYACALRMSSICAKSAAEGQAWYKHKTIQRIGRAQYCPPESTYCRHAPVDPLAWDVWALGVCMYAFLFRAMPFQSMNCHGFSAFAARGIDAIVPQDQRGVVPADALDLVERCLRVDPGERIRAQDIMRHPFLAAK